MLSRGKLTYHVNAHGHMRNRPMGELIRVLSKLKVNIELGDENSNFWIQVQGPIEDSDVNIDVDASESTQFATGMFLACYDLSLSINTSNMDTSATYFMLTKKLVELAKSGTRSYIVPPDASSLSYPLAAGLILGSINVTNCTEVDDIQADSEFIKIIKDIGGDISFGSTGLEIKSNSRELKGIDWDCSGCPDLVPTLAFTAAYLNNVSKIRNIKVLRHKESDRINEILKLLKIFKIKHDYSEDEDVLTINGCGEDFKIMEEVELFPPEDHRIVMVSYLFLRRNSGGILHNTGHVAKSFPTFFKVMEN
jgi:3-phosphoshikimate 1-carboxyvinyltransferase